MITEAVQQRFAGIERLYGQGSLAVLQSRHVAIVGIGGVGSWAAEALVRSGVGTVSLFDLDDICISNTNRQIHTTTQTLGQAKVDVMAQRLLAINPELICHPVSDFITANNVAERLTQEYHFVLDATDSVKNKVAMIVHCKRNKIPIYVVGSAGGQSDPTCIQYSDLTRAEQDPLLALTRKKLRQEHGYSSNLKRRFSIECVYSNEPVKFPQPDGSVCSTRPALGANDSTRLDCSGGIGASVCVTASFGLIASSRILKKLLDKSSNTSKD